MPPRRKQSKRRRRRWRRLAEPGSSRRQAPRGCGEYVDKQPLSHPFQLVDKARNYELDAEWFNPEGVRQFARALREHDVVDDAGLAAIDAAAAAGTLQQRYALLAFCKRTFAFDLATLPAESQGLRRKDPPGSCPDSSGPCVRRLLPRGGGQRGRARLQETARGAHHAERRLPARELPRPGRRTQALTRDVRCSDLLFRVQQDARRPRGARADAPDQVRRPHHPPADAARRHPFRSHAPHRGAGRRDSCGDHASRRRRQAVLRCQLRALRATRTHAHPQGARALPTARPARPPRCATHRRRREQGRDEGGARPESAARDGARARGRDVLQGGTTARKCTSGSCKRWPPFPAAISPHATFRTRTRPASGAGHSELSFRVGERMYQGKLRVKGSWVDLECWKLVQRAVSDTDRHGRFYSLELPRRSDGALHLPDARPATGARRRNSSPRSNEEPARLRPKSPARRTRLRTAASSGSARPNRAAR